MRNQITNLKYLQTVAKVVLVSVLQELIPLLCTCLPLGTAGVW